MAGDPTHWQVFRPEIVGTVMDTHGGDAWTMAICFASEAAAREVDRMKPSAEARHVIEQVNALNVGEPRYYDFKQPLLYTRAADVTVWRWRWRST